MMRWLKLYIFGMCPECNSSTFNWDYWTICCTSCGFKAKYQ